MRRFIAAIALVTSFAPSASPAATVAADGAILISQADALAGNVTPGDMAGYPITITRAGKYRLKSNLNPTARQYGILIQANSVTVDMNGFVMAGGGAALSGFFSADNYKGLTVQDGTIRSFVEDGIYFHGPELRVENMRIAGNGRYGINELYVNAVPKTGKEDGNTIIKNNIIMSNTQGITCQAGCHIEGNVISHSTYSGIIISQSGATVINNTISNNGGYGVVGNYIGLGGNTLTFNGYCHTSGVMLVMERNAVYPTSTGTYCTALPQN